MPSSSPSGEDNGRRGKRRYEVEGDAETPRPPRPPREDDEHGGEDQGRPQRSAGGGEWGPGRYERGPSSFSCREPGGGDRVSVNDARRLCASAPSRAPPSRPNNRRERGSPPNDGNNRHEKLEQRASTKEAMRRLRSSAPSASAGAAPPPWATAPPPPNSNRLEHLGDLASTKDAARRRVFAAGRAPTGSDPPFLPSSSRKRGRAPNNKNMDLQDKLGYLAGQDPRNLRRSSASGSSPGAASPPNSNRHEPFGDLASAKDPRRRRRSSGAVGASPPATSLALAKDPKRRVHVTTAAAAERSTGRNAEVPPDSDVGTREEETEEETGSVDREDSEPSRLSLSTETQGDYQVRPGAVHIPATRGPATSDEALADSPVIIGGGDADAARAASGTGRDVASTERLSSVRAPMLLSRLPTALLVANDGDDSVGGDDDDHDDYSTDSGEDVGEDVVGAETHQVAVATPLVVIGNDGGDNDVDLDRKTREDAERRRRRKKYQLPVASVAIVVIVVLVVMLYVFVPAGTDQPPRQPSSSPTFASPALTDAGAPLGELSSPAPSVPKPAAPSTTENTEVYAAFNQNDPGQLYDAVDLYLRDNSSDTAVARRYGHPIGDWDVSQVSDFSFLFGVKRNGDAANFDEDLGDWDMSNARVLNYMFSGSAFRGGDLSRWDVSAATSMHHMFAGCAAFNGDVSDWDTSLVIRMDSMFSGATAFNGDLSRWDVSKVVSMDEMFQDAINFNSDLSGWDIVNVVSFQGMFFRASSFNQSLCGWRDQFFASASAAEIMFLDTACPDERSPDPVDRSPLCHDCLVRRWE